MLPLLGLLTLAALRLNVISQGMRPESVSNYSLTVPLHRQVDMTPTSVNFLVFLTETPDIRSERRALAHNCRGCCPQWEQRRGGIIQKVCGRDGHVVSCLGQEAKRTNPEVRVKYDLQSIPPATCFYPNRAVSARVCGLSHSTTSQGIKS